jgi:hypothetical protein
MEAVMTLDGEKPKAKRGFAAFSPERRREIAARGGGNLPPARAASAEHPRRAIRNPIEAPIGRGRGAA